MTISTETSNLPRSYVSRVMRATLLAPDIIEAILDGRQPKHDPDRPHQNAERLE
ncbi:MAG: hypothetical protein U1E36_02325 [Rickettsiales bacterium]